MLGSQHSLFPFCVPIIGDDHLNTLSNPYPIPALTSTLDERLTLKLIESTWKETLTSLLPALPHVDRYTLSPVWKDRKLTLLLNSSLSPLQHVLSFQLHHLPVIPQLLPLSIPSTLLLNPFFSVNPLGAHPMPSGPPLLHPAFAL